MQEDNKTTATSETASGGKQTPASIISERGASKNRFLRLFNKGLFFLKEFGILFTAHKVLRKIRFWLANARLSSINNYDENELKQQRESSFPRNPKYSILVPLYNTPASFLHEMIQSVLDQTYPNWELCLADGSTSDHSDVEEICRNYHARDSRIVYRKLEKNLGISGNTNACVDMSTGDYIVLFDHDDLLHPCALFEVTKAICETGADFVYTDEATFRSPRRKDVFSYHFKPDYSVDNLRANNYICHLSVFSKALMDKTGGFRSQYDGSQDHDLILRLTANAEKVVHIPRVLYYWRSHPLSVAQDISSKTYAIQAGVNAVKDSITQQGMDAIVESSPVFPTIYRIRYEIVGEPKVSIVICDSHSLTDLKRCVDSVLAKSTYRNFEILVAHPGSDEDDQRSAYLQSKENVRLFQADGEICAPALRNRAAAQATGDYILFLESDTEIITADWIQEMLMYAQRKDVAAVGAILYYPDDTIHHAGYVVNMGAGRPLGNCYRFLPRNDDGYMGRLYYSQNLSAVSDACMMVKRSAFEAAGGFDETYRQAFADGDLCLKLGGRGGLIVWTPYAELYRHTKKDMIQQILFPRKYLSQQDQEHFEEKWKDALRRSDPCFSPYFENRWDDLMF